MPPRCLVFALNLPFFHPFFCFFSSSLPLLPRSFSPQPSLIRLSPSPFYCDSIYFDIYLPFIPLSALSSRPPPSSYLLPLRFASSPLFSSPLPSYPTHLISDTLTWLSTLLSLTPLLLPREAGEPLFPLIPANAICKRRQPAVAVAAATYSAVV